MTREHTRISGRSELEVAVDFESDHNFYTGLTRNISAGGVFVATYHLQRVGDRVNVRLTLPGSDRPLFVETEVRWIRGKSAADRQDQQPGMGLRFINLSSEAAAAIQRFLNERDSIYYDDDL